MSAEESNWTFSAWAMQSALIGRLSLTHVFSNGVSTRDCIWPCLPCLHSCLQWLLDSLDPTVSRGLTICPIWRLWCRFRTTETLRCDVCLSTSIRVHGALEAFYIVHCVLLIFCRHIFHTLMTCSIQTPTYLELVICANLRYLIFYLPDIYIVCSVTIISLFNCILIVCNGCNVTSVCNVNDFLVYDILISIQAKGHQCQSKADSAMLQ